MTDLDKMARELLADQYECDLPWSEIAKRLRGEFEGQLRVADIIALAAIRAALLTAPPGWKLVPIPPTDDMIEAAQDSHMPFGDMHFAITSAILAAPEPK